MVKYSNSVLVAALVAGPALTLAREHVHSGHISSRDVASDEARAVFARDVDFAQRDLEGLVARDPFFLGKILKKVLPFGSRDLEGDDELAARELEEMEDLSARSPFFRKVLGGLKRKITGRPSVPEQPQPTERDFDEELELTARDFEELEELAARSPFFRKALGGLKRKITGRPSVPEQPPVTERDFDEEFELTERDFEDFEELAARSPFFRKVLGGLKRKITGRPSPSAEQPPVTERDFDELELTERDFEDFEELAARSPFFRKALGGLKRKITGRPSVPEQPPVTERDFDEELELTARDFEELEELAARSPFFRKALGGLKRKITGRPSVSEQPQPVTERDLEDLEDLASRSPFFRKAFRKIAGRPSPSAEQPPVTERDFEDLELTERDLEDLEARNPFFLTKMLKKVLPFGSRDFEGDNELSARDFDELEELASRSPFFRKALGGLKRKITGRPSPSAEQPPVTERDFDDLDEGVYAREFFGLNELD